MTAPPPPPDGGGAVPSANPYAPPSPGAWAGGDLPPPPPPVNPQVYPQAAPGGPQYPPPGYPQQGYLPPAPTPVHPLLYPNAPVTLEQAVTSGRPVRAAGWGIPDFFIAFGLWIMFSVVALGIGALLFGDAEMLTGPGIIIGMTVPWIGLAGWPLLVTWWKGNGPVIDLGLTFRASDLLWGLIYGVGALFAAGIIAAVTTAFAGEFDSAAGELANSLDSMVILLLFGIAVGIGAPIAEELAFRGLLFGALAKRGMPTWLVIGLSGLLFSLIHFEPIRVPLLLSTGIILGIARWHTRSTTVPILAHMVNNIPAAIALVVFGV